MPGDPGRPRAGSMVRCRPSDSSRSDSCRLRPGQRLGEHAGDGGQHGALVGGEGRPGRGRRPSRRRWCGPATISGRNAQDGRPNALGQRPGRRDSGPRRPRAWADRRPGRCGPPRRPGSRCPAACRRRALVARPLPVVADDGQPVALHAEDGQAVRREARHGQAGRDPQHLRGGAGLGQRPARVQQERLPGPPPVAGDRPSAGGRARAGARCAPRAGCRSARAGLPSGRRSAGAAAYGTDRSTALARPRPAAWPRRACPRRRRADDAGDLVHSRPRGSGAYRGDPERRPVLGGQPEQPGGHGVERTRASWRCPTATGRSRRRPGRPRCALLHFMGGMHGR